TRSTRQPRALIRRALATPASTAPGRRCRKRRPSRKAIPEKRATRLRVALFSYLRALAPPKLFDEIAARFVRPSYGRKQMGRGGNKHKEELANGNAAASGANGNGATGFRGSRLLPAQIAAKLPKLYETDGCSETEKMALVKFFTLGTGWTHFAFEFDGEDRFFGYVFSGIDPAYDELCYFSLSELEGVTYKNTSLHLVERDEHYTPVSYA